MKPQKSLGQHWLKDPDILGKIADYADLTPDDTVLEIGPGLGTLTAVLAQKAGKVIAVEFDKELARKLASNFSQPVAKSRHNLVNHPLDSSQELTSFKHPSTIQDSGLQNYSDFAKVSPNLNQVSDNNSDSSEFSSNAEQIPSVIVFHQDFLQFDLSQLPAGYKVVANIPYYITGKIIEKLLKSKNKPSVAVLLVQKEVAERITAKPGGDMSLLSVVAQYYADIELGIIVPAGKFTPPPKVDSQTIILRPKHIRSDLIYEKSLFRIVKAGFSQRRKKLRTSLAGGLNVSVKEAEKLLKSANINPNLRAQDLMIKQWSDILKAQKKGNQDGKNF